MHRQIEVCVTCYADSYGSALEDSQTGCDLKLILMVCNLVNILRVGQNHIYIYIYIYLYIYIYI